MPWLAPLLLALLWFAACSDSPLGAKGVPPIVELEPSGEIALAVGDTLRLQASVQNAPSGASLAFTTSDSSVARVSADGLLTAVKPGTATVLATLRSDTTARSVLLVRVLNPLEMPPSNRPASVLIESIIDPAGAFADLKRVSGLVFARLAVERGRASRIEVLLNGTLACAQEFVTARAIGQVSGSLARASILCPIPTAKYDSLTGTPAFRNGPASVVARLVGPDGVVLDQAEGVTLELSNSSRLLPRLIPERTAFDAAGREWVAGDVSVTALPVIYEADVELHSVRFSYEPPEGPSVAITDSAAPFAATFPEESFPEGLVDAGMRIRLGSLDTKRRTGPSSVSPVLRYDRAPPEPGDSAVVVRSWLGTETRFEELYRISATRDEGIGIVKAQFYVGEPGLSAPQIVARGREVRVARDLDESAAGAYELAVGVCDLLENCATVPGFRFGVDLTPPSIQGSTLPLYSVNPARAPAFLVDDQRSGLPERPLEASVTLLDASAATPECGAVVAGIRLPGKPVGTSCQPERTGTTLPLPASPGYYIFDVRAVDAAGNRSQEMRRHVLVDDIAPMVAGLSLPATLTGGSDVRLSAAVADNLDLASASFAWIFSALNGGSRQRLPFAEPVVWGSPFDGELSLEKAPSATIPVVRSLTRAAPDAASGRRVTVALDSVELVVADRAGLRSRLRRLVTTDGATVSAAFREVGSAVLRTGSGVVCTAACVPGDVLSTTLSAVIAGPSGMRNPFRDMHFYRENARGEAVWLGSTRTISVVETGDARVLTYSFSYTPAANLAGDFPVFAVGVSTAGDALMTEPVLLHLFTRSP